ncbi:hypothetical protein [Aureimonas mangrovi]|uniref:hypothetical protein n=1 Tax=Aureimonas mangrovi TaxID=2758041 RepID=UPI00163D5969|nr:hypothetical protein [Aureimonas mangrovi]
MTDDELDAINEKISNLFEGKTLDEVATVLKIQLAMLVTQGSENSEDVSDFLDEITTEVEDMVADFDFTQASEGSPS